MKNNTIDKLLTALEDGTLKYTLGDRNRRLDFKLPRLNKSGQPFPIEGNLTQYRLVIDESLVEFKDDAELDIRVRGLLSKAAASARDSSIKDLDAALSSINKLETAKIIDKLAEVDAKFEVTAQDLADGLTRVGDTAKDANVSLNELLSCIKVIQEKTNRGGAVIGNALKTIFTRLKRLDTIEALMSAEVGSYDVSWYLASYRGAIAILKDYKDIRDSLDQSKRDFLDEQIAGVYQINALRALLKAL